MQTETGKTGRLHRWALLLVCLAAFYLRLQGVNWPCFHPDERPIGEWVTKAVAGGALKDKLYAHGFFQLVKPFAWAAGAVDYTANVVAFHRGLKERAHRTENNAVMVARWFNVWAGTLLCLAGYLLVRRITRSPWAGVLGAALLGLAQYPVEHSHYAETDIAMLLVLTFALWLMAVALDTGAKRNLAFAALVSGFAAGTKFQLVLLAPVILIVAALLAQGPFAAGRAGMTFGRTVRRGSLMVLLALAGCILGFLAAMPEVTDWAWFRSAFVWEKARLYHETALNMGLLRGEVRVRYAMHFRFFLHALQSLGWGWLMLAAAGLPCLALKAYRRYWPVTVLFPGLYLVYFVFQAPWVRSQEFMAFLPVFAVLAVLPLGVLWQFGRVAARMAVVVLAVAAFTGNAINGSRSSSLFGWPDTRVLAQQWLEAHLPARSKIAVENYAEQACPETAHPSVIFIYKVEKDGFGPLARQGADYLLRAATISGRGLRNPLTRILYPDYQVLFDEFARKSERLCSWAPLPPQGLATFISPAIELYGLNAFVSEYTINLELPRPLWLRNYYDTEKGRQTFFQAGSALGTSQGVLIDSHPRVVAVGGPDEMQGPVYLVFNTAERSAKVTARGFGQKRQAALGPYDAAIIPLQRAPWLPRPGQFEKITLSVERVRDVLYVPCFARLAFTPAQAVRACLDLGAEEAVWKIFSEEELESACDPATAYLLAVRSARWSWAQKLQPAAERTARALANIARADPAALRINGNSGFYYNQFARIRVNETPREVAGTYDEHDSRWIVKEIATKDCLHLVNPARPEPGRPPLYEAALQLPLRLAGGRYQFTGEIMPVLVDPADLPSNIVFYCCGVNQGQDCARLTPTGSNTWTPLVFEFQAARELQPRFVVRAPAPLRLYFRNVEIRWDLDSRLDAIRSELGVARAAHSVAGAQYAEALRSLAELDPDAFRWNELEIRQLELAVASAIDDRAASTQAARRLLELAPWHYEALRALGEIDPGSRSRAQALEANLKMPVEFGSHLRLVGITMDPVERKVRCVWEATKNETPGMAATFWIRRRGEWRRKQVMPLSARPWLAGGERVALEVRLDEVFEGYTPETIAVGLETAVRWHAGAVPAAGRPDGVVCLGEVLE